MNVEQTLEMARRTDLLPATLPFFWVAVIFILAAALWLGLRHVTRKYAAKLPFYGMFAPRLVGAVVASWAGFQVIGRFLEYGCRWPIWGAALATGFAVELTAGLYLRERRVIPDRLGLILTTLRSLVIALTAVLIMQPTWVRMKERHFERRVAVLFDDTQSMQFKDELWTVSEKLALGRAFGKVSASDNPLPSLSKLNALQPQLRAFFPTADARVEGDARITGLLEGGLRSAESLRDELDKCLKDLPQAQQAQRDVLERTRRLVWDQVGASLNSAAQLAKNGTWAELTPGKVMDALRQFEEASALARTAVDEVYWEGLDEAARAAVDALCTTTRVELATRLLTSQDRRGGVFLDKLGARYDVDLFRMGQRIERIPKLGEKTVLVEEEDAPALTNLLAAAVAEEEAVVEAGLPDDPLAPPRRAVAQTQTQWDIRQQASQAFRMSTDFTMGLEGLQKEISQEMLAGAIIVSDGLHNGTASFDPIARRFGAQGVPVMGVRVGGSRLPFDIAVADVIAPESVFLGDNVRVRAIVQATNAKGQKLNVHLCFEGSSNVVETVVMEVTSDNWHQEHRFKHQPEAQGIVRYEVRTDVLEGELFDDNNAWAVDVAVSDDRTNVLLLDEMPRWEFRYLRNLFFGRDKSVHLQYYLNRPDTLADTPPPLLPPASATRKFGDAEAGDLPDSREEWRRFDVIILGDLPPTVLTEEVLEDIYHCVSDRGALLVMIAGPESMPHAYPDDSLLWKMLPLTLDPSHVMFRDAPDAEGYTLALTPAGKAHPVLQQSSSYAENDAIWQQMPDFAWRVPLDTVKVGAEVLAYAQPVGDLGQRFSFGDAAAQLDETVRRQKRNAVIVASRFGQGKVLSLMFDRTWRFRYRVGDTYHHRFWGQVMRWGVGEKLRSGDEYFRVGTDQVVYMPGMPIQIMGRVMNPDGSPVQKTTLEAAVYREDGTSLGKQRLNYRENSNGFYEAEFKGIETPGRYTVRLARRDMAGASVETSFLVSPTRRPVELADVAATSTDLQRVARWTGGRVVEPDELDQLLEAFGEGRRTVPEPVVRPLWDNPLLFLVIVGLLTAEWILRKKGNLV